MGKNCTGPAAGPAPAPGNGGTHERGNDFLTAIWPAGNHPVVDCALQQRHRAGLRIVLAPSGAAAGSRSRLYGPRSHRDSGRRDGLPPAAAAHHAAVHRGGHRRAVSPLRSDLRAASRARRWRRRRVPAGVLCLVRRRFRRDDVRRARQRARGECRAAQLPGGAADRVPGGHDLRDVHGGPGAAGRHHHFHGVQRERDAGAGGLRLRGLPGGGVHARGRRDLHQSGRRRRRSRRKSGGWHS